MPVVPVLKADQTSAGVLEETHLFVVKLTSHVQSTIPRRVEKKELEAILWSISENFLWSIISHCKQLLIALLIIKANF